MLEQYRVTKYNPSRRDAAGRYAIDDWTSYSDVGKSFGGEVLTEARYRTTEDAYLQAALAFLEEAPVGDLRVVGLENHGGSADAPAEGSIVSLLALPDVLRALLREAYWCKLESAHGFIQVGYDYYMYIGVPKRCFAAEATARALGLFPESLQAACADDAAHTPFNETPCRSR